MSLPSDMLKHIQTRTHNCTHTLRVLQFVFTSEKQGHILQLGYVVFPVPTKLCEQWEVLEVLLAGVGGVELGELAEHHPPGLDLLFGVLNVRYGLPTNTQIYKVGHHCMGAYNG